TAARSASSPGRRFLAPETPWSTYSVVHQPRAEAYAWSASSCVAGVWSLVLTLAYRAARVMPWPALGPTKGPTCPWPRAGATVGVLTVPGLPTRLGVCGPRSGSVDALAGAPSLLRLSIQARPCTVKRTCRSPTLYRILGPWPRKRTLMQLRCPNSEL